jgi:hypothetical protein
MWKAWRLWRRHARDAFMRRRRRHHAAHTPALVPEFQPCMLSLQGHIAQIRVADLSDVGAHYDRVWALDEWAAAQAKQRCAAAQVGPLMCQCCIMSVQTWCLSFQFTQQALQWFELCTSSAQGTRKFCVVLRPNHLRSKMLLACPNENVVACCAWHISTPC